MIDLNKVTTSNLWYIVGYITSDGNLSIDGRHIDITSKDKEHLYNLRTALFLNCKIGSKFRSSDKIKEYFHLQFGDVKFYKYLLSLGLSSKKSLTLGVINVKDENFNDFLRGVIDGDGNISTWTHRSNLHRQWCLRVASGSSVFLTWLNQKIEKKFKVYGKIYKRQDKSKINPIYIIKFGKRNASIILKDIYYPNCLALERKLLQAQLCLQSGVKMVN